MALPAWLALTVQLPTANSVSAVLLTVQIPGVVVMKATAKPAVEVAVSAAGVLPRV